MNEGGPTPSREETRTGVGSAVDFHAIEVISFDCYGTLIDWESGILAALRPLLAASEVGLGEDALLALYGQLESEEQAGEYLPYREVLRRVMRRIAQELRSDSASEGLLVDSLPKWPAFPDTAGALRELQKNFRLAIISNVDRDLFARSAPCLGIDFDWVITAEDAESYKPSPKSFELASTLMGVPKQCWLHAAQSLFHDIAPANAMGLSTVWVHRRQGREGFGATPPAEASPDLVVGSLAELVRRARGGRAC